MPEGEQKMPDKKRVLFVCTHNSVRSQMAEGYMRAKHGDAYEVFSAGTDPTRLHPLAVTVMKEIGIDISGQKAKPLLDLFDQDFDIAVTVCDTDSGTCPMIPGAGVVLHQGFPNPGMCHSQDECLTLFRSIRDEIATWIERTFT
jgi:arsenate reductase (thioredoxin)